MTRKPLIAITLGIDSRTWAPQRGDARFQPYADAIRRAGGHPEPLGIERAAEVAQDPRGVLDRYDGLLLSGGADIHPAAYPNPPDPGGRPWEVVLAENHMRVDEDRDAMELALAQAAFAAGRPTFGICRGFQVLNVALGGRLILDLDPQLGHQARPDSSSAEHAVDLVQGTRVAEMLGGSPRMQANSRHHQGVHPCQVAPALTIAAMAEDGIVVEALECPGHPWMAAVQWHPERTQDAWCHERSWPLFQSFITACSR